MPEICSGCGRPIPRRKITEEVRLHVRLLRQRRMRQKKIAAILNISQGSVSRILSGTG